MATDGVPGVTPSHPLVVFDGVCGLCDWWIFFLLKWDRHGRFRFATLQGVAGRAALEATIPELAPGESVVLIEQGRAFVRSTATLRILAQLGFPWWLASLFWVVPRPIRDAVYDWVARHRYDWFGKRETCRLPTAAERERFLGE